MTEKIKGFKGFDKDMKCRGFQFENGKTFETDSVKMCEKGFHFCEHPLNVFDFYPPATSRYAEVEGEGKTARTNEDTKVCCSKIHIGAEVNFSAMVSAAIKFVFDRAKWEEKDKATGYRGAASATGTRGAASATGYQGAASATGDQGAASATGYRGAASATGTQGAAVSLGYEARAMGSVGCWLTIAEWKEEGGIWNRVDVQTRKVDGKKIKADTWYMLKGGKFVEAK